MSLTYKTPVRYKIKCELFGESDSEIGKDIQSFTVFRTPFTKTASFAVLSVSLRMKHYLTIEEYTQATQYLTIPISIFLVNNQDTASSMDPEEIRQFCKKNYICIHIEPLEQVRPQSPYVQTLLYLVHPVLFYMNNTNGYNVIEEDITAFEALENFESWCSKTFGDSAFQFKKVGEDHEQNDWNYEQLLIRQDCDLNIPTYLINSYKVWHTYGYYFFDDFRITDDDDEMKDITAWGINLGNIESFEKKDIRDDKYRDVLIANRFQKTQVLMDTFAHLWKESPSVVVKGYDQQFAFRKATSSKNVPYVTSTVQSSGPSVSSLASPPSLSSGLSSLSNSSTDDTSARMNTIISSFSKQSADPTEQTLLYAPDQPEKAEYRFELNRQLLADNLRAISTFYLRDCHLDFFQFNYRYNLSSWAEKDFSYVPISIVNMFIRDSGQVPILTHNAKYQVLKYYSEESSSSSSSSSSTET